MFKAISQLPESKRAVMPSDLKFPSAEQLRHLVTFFLSDDSAINVIAENSYWHPNGFVKIVLRKQPDGTTLRLHRWLERERESTEYPKENIHSHRWCFCAQVLCGSIEVEEYVKNSSKGDLFTEYTCSANLLGHYEIFPCRDVHLRLARRHTIYQGQFHVADLSTIHRVCNRANGTATLIVHEQPMSSTSSIYRRYQQGMSLQPDIVKLTKEDVRENLLWLSRSLSDN